MTSSLRRGTTPRPCTVCKKQYTPSAPLQKACSLECALEHSREKRAAAELKAEKKIHAERKKAVQPKSKVLSEAQAAFNKYIRERDQGECISCQRAHTGQYHAGHYRSVGSMSSLRFNTYNCHKQCSACNNHLGGNLILYRGNLIKKLGLERVEWLEGPHDTKKYTIGYLRRVKRIFNKRARHIKRLRQ